MTTETITLEQIAAAKEIVRIAASKGQSVYIEADNALRALEKQYKLQQMGDSANDVIVVVGNTYKNSEALKRLGLQWSKNLKGWYGRRSLVVNGVPVRPGAIRAGLWVSAANKFKFEILF